MKKLLIFAAVAGATLCSCQKGAMKPSLKDNADTIAYEVGLANSGYVSNVMQQSGIDSVYLEEFLAGVKEGTLNAEDKKKVAHYLGVMFGLQNDMQLQGIDHQIYGNDSTKHLSRRNVLAGIINGAHNRSNLAINGKPIDAAAAQMDVQGRIEALHAKQFEAYKKECAKFLAENAKKQGVKTLPSGVQYRVLTEGTGEKPTADQRVNIFYEGKLVDGTLFDSNYDQDQPMPVMASQMIPGFKEALTAMPVGSEWEIVIPAELAYGDREMGQIKPGSVLVFKVKLVSVAAGQPAAPQLQPQIEVQ